MDAIKIITGGANVCRDILDDLPEWSGLPEAKEAYIDNASRLPMLAFMRDQQPVGFISIKRHTMHAAELYVLGVKRQFHRRGIGRALLRASIDYARASEFDYLTVKTLAATHPDPYYAETRTFYEAVGFLPIETFPTLWGATNPCVLMILPVK